MAHLYTAGPWTLDERPGSSNIIVRGGHISGLVASVNTNWPHPYQCIEQKANARLMAAAPDMLAALVALSTNPHGDLSDMIYHIREREGEGWDGPAVTAWSEAVTAARSAIAKATGEEA